MAGKGKTANPQNYVNAWYIMNLNSWFRIDLKEDFYVEGVGSYSDSKLDDFPTENVSRVGRDVILHCGIQESYIPSDVIVQRKILFERLSESAREIINTVCYGSSEITKNFEVRGDNIREKKVFKYYKMKWKNTSRVKKAFKEIKQFVYNL